MYVRVFNKKENTYFKSIVYAILGIGWEEHFIVLNPSTNAFELIEIIEDVDISGSSENLFIEHIQDDCMEFHDYTGSAMLKYKYFCKEKGISCTIGGMHGYKDVCDNYAFLAELIEKKSIPAEAYDITIRDLEDKEEWNYILTQDDADDFMKMFAGFHDSTLEKISYWEGDRSTSAIATFDNSGWFGIVELCFEGIQLMKILPPKPNCIRDIYDAALIVEDESVFWADGYMKNIDMEYDGSIIKSLSLKWRKI